MKYLSVIIILLISTYVSGQQTYFKYTIEPELSNPRYILGTTKSRTSSISMGDVDGDGDLDALIANGRHWPEPNKIFLNSHGRYTTFYQLGDQFSTSYAAEFADMDNDGDLDIVEGNELAPHRLYTNNGNGVFEYHSEIGIQSSTRNIVLADIDQDQYTDILICNRAHKNMICYNQGDLIFQCVNLETDRNATIDIEVSDLNNDDLPDIIIANRDMIPNMILLNRGNRIFEKAMDFGSGTNETRSVDVADINNDGFKDIITGNINGENQIFMGDERFEFKEVMQFGSEDEDTYSIKVSDFNRDGYADILAGNNGTPSAVFLNKQGEYFERINLSTTGLRTYDVQTGDINQDGWDDIIIANSDEYNFYLINNFKSVINK